jgi:lipoate-protein ligase A
MFIEPGNTITYSLTVPASLVDGLSYAQSYPFLDDWVLGALADVGVQARYVPLNDIASPEGKIAGAAQKRLASGAVLHHVTMAYDIDQDKMLQVLRIGREKMSDKGTTSANKRVDPLRSQTGKSRAAVIEAFKDHFRARYRTVDGRVSPAERARAARAGPHQVRHARVDSSRALSAPLPARLVAETESVPITSWLRAATDSQSPAD